MFDDWEKIDKLEYNARIQEIQSWPLSYQFKMLSEKGITFAEFQVYFGNKWWVLGREIDPLLPTAEHFWDNSSQQYVFAMLGYANCRENKDVKYG